MLSNKPLRYPNPDDDPRRAAASPVPQPRITDKITKER